MSEGIQVRLIFKSGEIKDMTVDEYRPDIYWPIVKKWETFPTVRVDSVEFWHYGTSVTGVYYYEEK